MLIQYLENDEDVRAKAENKRYIFKKKRYSDVVQDIVKRDGDAADKEKEAKQRKESRKGKSIAKGNTENKDVCGKV